MAEHYEWFLPIFRGFDWDIKRADAIRYFALYHYGGVYADLDVELLRPIDELLDIDDEVVLTLENETNMLANAVMISPKARASFWERVWMAMVRHKDEITICATGPPLLSKTYNDAGRPHTVLSYETFHAASRADVQMEKTSMIYDMAKEAQSYGIHWCKTGWANEYNQAMTETFRYDTMVNGRIWCPPVANIEETYAEDIHIRGRIVKDDRNPNRVRYRG